MRFFRLFVLVLAGAVLAVSGLRAQRQMESLGRGLVVLRNNSTQTYVGWRLLGDDPRDIAFNLYRSADGGAPVKLNSVPLAATTDYVDTPGSALLAGSVLAYSVRPVLDGIEVPDTWAHPSAPSSVALPAGSNTRQYVPVPLQPTPDGPNSGHSVKFAWVGDLDGDGEYDFVVERTPSVAAAQWIQAYRRDGTLLWQMSQGPNSIDRDNIYPGSSAIAIGHNDNVTVFDLDGDGRAEVCVLVARGVVFANGSVLSAADDEIQYLSVIDGLTGAEKARAQVPVPASWPYRGSITGQMGVVYADGLRPSLFFKASNRDPATLRFNKFASAWDYRDGVFSLRWLYDFEAATEHTAEGHQVRFADVDNDGRDEYVDVGHVLKADGSGQINGHRLNEVVHGDRFHVTDIDPDRPGLETYLVQQNNGSGLATAYHSADKSAVIKKLYAAGVVDVGRGTVGGFVPALPGLQMFSTFGGTYDARGNQLYASAPFPPETIWWDADLGREFLSTIGSSATSPGIDKFNTANGGSSRVVSLYSDANAPGSPYNNYIAYGGRPQLWGDILGDWREELVCVASDNSELRIYTTRTPDIAKSHDGVAFRIPALMHDPQYRVQATAKGYVQSSYPGYYLGYGMSPPPPAPMVRADHVWTSGPASAAFQAGRSVRFDLSGDHSAPVAIPGLVSPGDVTVYSPNDYAFDGSSGSLGGPMRLLKSGRGALRLTGSHPYSGATAVWDGALRVDGALTASPVTVWGGVWGGAAARGLTGGRLAGSGSVAGPVVLRHRGAITPGPGMNAAGTLSLGSGLVARDGSVLAFDLSADPTGVVLANDRLAIAGDLALSGTVSIVVNPLSGALSPGAYTLATYTGALTGSVANLAVTVPDGTPWSVAIGGGALTLVIPETRPAGSVVWTGAASGVWDLASAQNWRRDGAPDVFVSGDSVRFDDTGAARPSVVLDVAAPVAGLVVSGSTDYSISGAGAIAGPGGLAKSGPGTLSLSTANTFTGPVSVTGGVLAVPSLSDAGEPGPLGASTGDAANLLLDGGALRLVGAQTSMNRSATLGPSGGAIDIGAGTSLQISGALTGPGALAKTGAGTLLLAGANSHAGGTVIDGGKIYLAGSVANRQGLGSGPVTIRDGTLSMADVQNNDVAAWNIVVPAGASARLDADGRCGLTGALTGSGDLTYFSPYVRSDLRGDWSAFAGRLFHVGGDMRFSNTRGLALAALDLAADTYAYSTVNSTHVFPIGALSGSGRLSGTSNSGRTVTWQIGARNADTTFAGVISNGSGVSALAKVGSGSLTLSAAQLYTGSTAVSAGKLVLVGGSLASSVTVSTGAAFGGAGSVSGSVSFAAGSVLLAVPSVGPLAVAGDLVLSGSVTVSAAPGASLVPGTYPLITYTGSLTGQPAFVWSDPAYGALIDASVPGRIDLVVTRPAADLVWTGAASADWNASALNWTWSGAPLAYQDADRVRFDDTSSVVSVALPADVAPGSITVDSSKNFALTGAGRLVGPAALLKTGSGSLTLSTAHAFTGGATLSGGSVVLGNSAGLGAGVVTLAGGSLTLNTALSAPVHVAPEGGRLVVAANRTLSGAITGTGTLSVNASANLTVGNVSAFEGVVHMGSAGGLFRANSSGFAGGPAWTLDLGSGSAAYTRSNSAATVRIGALAGGPATALNNGATATTYVVGEKNVSTVFSGAITGAASLSKAGSSSLVLAGASTYTGPTTVSSGSLLVTGSLGVSAVSVAPDAVFGGTGALGGALSLSSGARLALGVAPSGIRGPSVAGAVSIEGPVVVVPALLGGALAPGTYPLLTYTGALAGEPLFSWSDTSGSGYSATFNASTPGLVSITLVAPSSLATWRLARLGSAVAVGPAADLADPDGDSLPNLLEYALAADPLSPDASALVAGLSPAPALRLVFNRVADPGLSYVVQASSDLVAWTDIWTSSGHENQPGPVTVTDPVALSAALRRFLRLRVTYLAP